MCSDCDDEPICYWCGDTCLGTCDNPDACRTCWFSKYSNHDDALNEDYGEDVDACLEDYCQCKCHEELFFDMGMTDPIDGPLLEDGTPFVRNGVFPFLSLPSEIRNKLYGYALKQDGTQRVYHNHRGTIHTALLSTCRQVYNEAGHLPFTLNRSCFGSSLSMLDFVGFLLTRKTRLLLTEVEIEMHPMATHDPDWALALKRLNSLTITHLSLTFVGPYSTELFKSHTCIIDAFSTFKDLKSLRLRFASHAISDEQSRKFQEVFRAKLLDGHSSQTKAKNSHSKSLKKIATGSKVKVKTREPAKPRRGVARPSARTCTEMIHAYEQLKLYALSLDSEITAVKIRLGKARVAAEAGKQSVFEKLVDDIGATLEEQFNKITIARNALMQGPSSA